MKYDNLIKRKTEKYNNNVMAVEAITLLLKQYDFKSTQMSRRRLEILYDIIDNNTQCDYFELYRQYSETNDMFLKNKIRYGNEGLERLKQKLKNKKKAIDSSHFSINFWLKRGYSEIEAREKVREIQSNNSKKRHAKATVESYRNIPQCIEYWLNRGFSHDEAKQKKKEYLDIHVRSYKNMIRKYGYEEGIKNINEAQVKRKKTIFEKFEVTTFGGHTSKKSIKLFKKLYKKCRRLGISKDDIFWGISGSREFATYDNGKNYFYDFTIKSLKIAIEFNGLYWHAREDVEWRRNDCTKEYSLEYDKNKRLAIENRGFKMFTIWEDCDIMEKIDEIFNEIKKEYYGQTI